MDVELWDVKDDAYHVVGIAGHRVANRIVVVFVMGQFRDVESSVVRDVDLGSHKVVEHRMVSRIEVDIESHIATRIVGGTGVDAVNRKETCVG